MGFNLISTVRLPAYRVATWAYGRFRIGMPPRSGLRILMYHAIGTAIEGDMRHLYNISPVLFEKQMRYLALHYKDYLAPLDRSELKVDTLKIALTFDDGYQDNLLVAAPLMVELGIPFTIFVCTRAVAERRVGFLSPEEVRELADLPGAKIGSHTINHLRLTECNNHRLAQELIGSKAYLEDLLGCGINTLSYPHGAVDRRVMNAAEEAGYCLGASSRFDINRPDREPLVLCRTDVWEGDNLAIFGQKLRGDWDWSRWRSADPVNKKSKSPSS